MTEAMPPVLLGATSRLRALDGVRLLAALSVVGFHYTARDTAIWGRPTAEAWPTFAPITQYGFLGVELFFMISGFVVLLSAWGRTVGQFAASRISRIYPTYWLVLAAVLALYVLFPALRADEVFFPMTMTDRLVNVSMLQTAMGVQNVIGPAWTLFYEALFYLMLLVFCAVGFTRNRILVFAFLWPLVAAAAQTSGFGFFALLLGEGHAAFFCIGMMLYFVYRDGWSAPVVFVLVVDFGFAMHYGSTYATAWNDRVVSPLTGHNGLFISGIVIAILIALMIGLILLLTLTPLSRIHWSWLTFAGAITYPLYLIHEEFGWAMIRALQTALPDWVTLVLTTVVMVALAWLIFQLFERPVLPRVRKLLERSLVTTKSTRGPIND